MSIRKRCPLCSLPHQPRCRDERRWPLAPLEAQRPTLRDDLHLSTGTYRQACDQGLSDATADRWAIRLGLHPAQVWPDWFDAALTAVDAHRIASGGWRPAWLHHESLSLSSEEHAA